MKFTKHLISALCFVIFFKKIIFSTFFMLYRERVFTLILFFMIIYENKLDQGDRKE